MDRAVDGHHPRLSRRAVPSGFAALPLGFFALFFAYPVARLLWQSFGGGDRARIASALLGEDFARIAWFTLWQAVASTTLTLLVALPAAWLVAHHRFPGRAGFRALATVPFVLPTVVVASAFGALFERLGVADGDGFRLRHTVAAVLLAHVFFNFAIVVRTVGTFWSHLDPRVEQAAAVLGASRLQVLWRITLPRLAPAIAAAAALVFLFSFTSFGIILILGGPTRATIETEIWRFATRRIEFDVAAAVAVVQLLAVLALVALTGRLQRRFAQQQRLVTEGRARPIRTARQAALAVAVIASSLTLLLAPLAILVERSLARGGGYSLAAYADLGSFASQIGTSPADALVNSLVIAVTATGIATIIGGIASLVVVHGRSSVSHLVDLAMLLPLGTSAVTLGLGMFVAFDTAPLDLRTSWWIVPLAHSLIGIPFVMRSVIPLLRSVDDRLRESAAVLGASPRHVRREIDLPIAARGIAVGAAFAFAVSLGEFGATSVLPRRPTTLTAPIAIFRLLGKPGDLLRSQAFALAVLLMVLTIVAVVAIEALRGQRTDEAGW